MVHTPQLPLQAVSSVVHTTTLFSLATGGLGPSTPLPRSRRLHGPPRSQGPFHAPAQRGRGLESVAVSE